NMTGPGTLKDLETEVLTKHSQAELAEKLKDFQVRLVLTAHPTQFYPSEVLGIIHDLAIALDKDDTKLVNTYLEQLGKTPFFKKQKPTPYDEAMNLIWFLEHVFYHAAGEILTNIKTQFPGVVSKDNPLIRLGFWPGGDRDGNPFVKADTTIRVAEALRGAIVRSYYRDVRKLKRRLTFEGVESIMATLEDRLYKNIFITGNKPNISQSELLDTLYDVRKTLIEKHNSLFLSLLDDLISKVELFGLYFASLDIRQDSSVHEQLIDCVVEKTNLLPKNYKELSENDKIAALLNIKDSVTSEQFDQEILIDTLESVRALKTIQQLNGEEGCHRYIISHTTSALNVIEVFAIFLLTGSKKEDVKADIVPLFETIDDLKNAAGVMKSLYENDIYRQHLKNRKNTQTIMLGFSDGTKDGGYLMANWSIYKSKEELTMLSKQYGVEVVFFDGRGGPPARGGGKTHQFYASMGKNIANKEIQLTIQGQTVSSNFGTNKAARFNIEQLMHAGISNALFSAKEKTLSAEEEELLLQLAKESYNSYNTLKNHPDFLEYLNYVSPLRYYAEANIGSRPSKRKSGKLNLEDLRAVPYVGSWSQLKQNLPGYYGVGMALEKLHSEGRWEEVKKLYKQSLFFKTLLDNCEMAMNKCFFPLTSFLASHKKYGELWKMVYEEFERTKKYLLMITGAQELMEDKPVDNLSIHMRQR
ncbi:MAG TPA: phosphoenolpyruvate carboxylase, partial [Cytophagaceae bacterium]